MSTNLTSPIAGNLAGNASTSCSGIYGLWPRVPEEWQDRESFNYTDRSCSVPACDNFPMTLASCCNSSISDLQQFDTEAGPYFTCKLADVADGDEADAAYQDYQTCLMVNFVDRFKCNDPRADSVPAVDNCDGQVQITPGDPAPDEQICGLLSGPNTTRAFMSCCSGAGSDGTGIIPYALGCQAGCVSDSVDMINCLRDTDAWWQSTYSCGTGEDLAAENGVGGGSRVDGLAALVGSVALLGLGAFL